MTTDPNMEKRNVIEDGRTPDLTKQAAADDFEAQATAAFEAMDKRAEKKAQEDAANG